ncbi:putative DNA primase/helicase [Methylobacterium sp. OAE515]|uniref:DUF7146 domain-containing protein n=1 Tax=Methylobacterium sp. OAE515 TaxID=2817895 RepID=UPI001788EB9A
MLNLRQMAHALGGEVAGGQVLCPGPGHSARDRSVVVRPDPGSPGGVLVHSHAGDDWRAVKDHVLGRLGISPERSTHAARSAPPSDRPAPVAADDLERRRRALAVWHAAGDPTDTVVERYLAGRGITLPNDPGAVLRFHAACAFGEERLPVMVAAMRCVLSDRLQAVHRTALMADGAKVGRKMLGPVGGAAVKLDPDDAVTTGLAIGEGIETCLAARQLGIRPAWALGSVGAIRVFPVLAGIEVLTILVESGDGGASEAAARVCGERWHAAGREVVLARPRVGGDMNDAVREARR